MEVLLQPRTGWRTSSLHDESHSGDDGDEERDEHDQAERVCRCTENSAQALSCADAEQHPADELHDALGPLDPTHAQSDGRCDRGEERLLVTKQAMGDEPGNSGGQGCEDQ